MNRLRRIINVGMLGTVVFLLLHAFPVSISAAEFSFQWDANTEPELAGYMLYFKSGSCCEPYDGIDSGQGDSPIKILPADLADPLNPRYTVIGLAENTIYFFALTALDSEGFESDYADELNNVPPVVGAVNVDFKTDVSAIISWQTDESATGRLDYGATDTYGSHVEHSELLTHHRMVITGLTPDMDYHFSVSATDADGYGPDTLNTDENPSADRAFTTYPNTGPDTSAPQIISGPVVVWKSDTNALIQWATDEPGNSELRYGAGSSTWSGYPSVKTEAVYVEDHTVMLTDLAANTAVYFRAGSTDLSGNGPETSVVDNNPSIQVSFITSSGPDTAAPQIVVPPTVIAKNDTTATIVWQTNEPADSVVDFGSTTSYTASRHLDETVIAHRVTLQGLEGGTLYHFRVSSTDIAGNGPTMSGDYTFTTEAASDTVAPQIVAAPSVIAKTDATATIAWDTDEPGSSEVHYDEISSLWGDYAFEKIAADPVSHHVVTIKDLEASTVYYFKVGSTDSGNNGPLTSNTDSNPSVEMSFTTLAGQDTTAPQIISPPTIVAKTNDSVTLEWSTDEPSSSLVQYGDATSDWGSYPIETISSAGATQHHVVITGLEPETRYYFRVGGVDSFNNGPNTSDVDNNPSTEISGLTDPFPDISAPRITLPPTITATSNTTAIVEWQTDEPGNSLVQYGTANAQWDAYPFSRSASVMTSLHVMTLTGLTAGTRYYVRVGSVDESGNGPTISNEIEFVTQLEDQAAPVITSPPTVTAVTDTTAIIEWETDEPCNSEVRYDKHFDTNPLYQWDTLPFGVTAASMVTQHRVTLTHLEVQTRYYFMAGSTDASGNGPDPSDTQSNNPFTGDSFTTDIARDVSAPKILAPPLVTAIDNRTATIEWETDEPSNSIVKFGENSTLQAIVGGTTWTNLPWVESDAEMKTIHRVTVTNLNPVTTYVFRAGSSDAMGNGPDLNQDPTNSSLMGMFTTTEGPDEIAPNISNVTVGYFTNKTALITWDSDEPGNSVVEYGEAGSAWGGYPSTEGDAVMEKTHSVTLTGIQPATQYFFRVGSTDAQGNGPDLNPGTSNPSDERTFTSAVGPDETAPQIIGGSVVASKTDNTAIIQWTTDEPGNSQVQYQTSSADWGTYDYAENDAELKTDHSVTLTDLSPDTLYYYRVSSTDASGNNHATSTKDRNPSIEYNLSTEKADPPSIIEYGNTTYPNSYPRVDYTDRFIEITYDEMNMQHALEEQNYAFGPALTWLDPDNAVQEITADGQVSTYRFYFAAIPVYTVITLQVDDVVTDADGYALYPNRVVINDKDADDLPDDWEVVVGLNPGSAVEEDGEGRNGDFDGDGVNNYTEFINQTDPKNFRSSREGSQIEAVIPHAGAGLYDATRVPFDTAFAVLIVDSTYGIDITDVDSVSFVVDDGVNEPFPVDLGDTAIMRTIKLNPDDPDTAATAFWAVYDRSQNGPSTYAFDTIVNVQVTTRNTQGFYFGATYTFRVESEAEHEAATNVRYLPDADTVDADDPDLMDSDYLYDAGIFVQTDDPKGAKIIYHSSQPNALFFGSNNELPQFNVENVTPIGDSLNLQPSSVFSVPAKLIIPCPGISDVSKINIYVYNGREWQLALSGSSVQEGGYGWVVPRSRINNNYGSSSSIEIKVYHFSGVQAGIVDTSVRPSGDSGSSPDEDVANCFLDTVSEGEHPHY
jgi:hypothetical protein